MKKYSAFLLLAVLPLAAQDKAAQEKSITREQADEIIKELRQIRQLLEKQQAKPGPGQQEEQPTRATITDLSAVSMLGSKTAPITIVEYTDYQCPFCQRFHLSAYPEIKKNYIDTGKARFYSKDLPLDFHPNAMRAAQAAHCAGEQGKFWQLRDLMGSNPDKLDMGHIMGFAADIKLDTQKMQECINSDKYKARVEADVSEAMRLGANGTPAFVIGKSAGEGVDGELVVGAMPYSMFDQKLREAAK
ncbi:MAG TPA: thioredoxin domain-containing protein [Candidatus Acidoferrales bacterium]|nr:thioredoxin domain-containing protein [Bryobacteraceae bacterium]HTS67129.1 thioredoxin domain-containing protein [Candidatus Acidoferrales bacterium]